MARPFARFYLVAFALLALLALVGSLGACKRSATASATAEKPPEVTAVRTDLVFTWIDASGHGHAEQRALDVPEEAREIVRVAGPDSEPAEGAIWVVDLRAPGADGTFAVTTMKRADWESLALARRDGGTLVARSATTAPPEARARVIIYGASWCGPCHQAAAHLRARGIPFVEKDIEADRDASREMQAKLSKSGQHGGSIPVLDVGGRILVGFDPRAVDAALAEPTL